MLTAVARIRMREGAARCQVAQAVGGEGREEGQPLHLAHATTTRKLARFPLMSF